jgi:hypothetical protein
MTKNQRCFTALLVAFPILFAAPIVSAEDTRESLAKQLVELLHLKDQFTEFKKACLSQGSAVTPEKLVEKSPNYFSGIKPDSPKWPVIVKAWQDYHLAVCSVPSEEQGLAIWTKYYQERLTKGQLRSAIKFYSSHDGKALVQVNHDSTGAFYDAIGKIRGELMATLIVKYQKEIIDISRSK